MGDYWDLTAELHFDVNLQRCVYLAALESELAGKLAAWARKQGVSTETLINLWLAEKLNAADCQANKKG